MKITVETRVAAPIDKVWKAYTTPEDIKQWNAASDDWHTTAASVDLREGPGAVTVRVTFDGEETHSEEQHRAGWQAILQNFARHVEAKR